jgi:hypothetical protein
MADNPEAHLNALELRLSHERDYLRNAKTDKERAFRQHQIKIVEKELEGEKKFLKKKLSEEGPELSDDELLAELLGTPKSKRIKWT